MGANSPYELTEFLHILITAAFSGDFVNNTSVKTQPAPNGQTVFNRLRGCTHAKIELAFDSILESLIKRIKVILRNRKVVLAFDTTYEPFYGDSNANNFWIHEYKPVRGCIGCFTFITVSIVVGEKKFILGVLPVPIHWNKADYVEKLIKQSRKFVKIDACLFDRGFTNYELIHRLKKLHVGYQILWKKDKKRETWLTKELKKLKPKQMKEYIKEDGYFLKDKSKHYVRTRFIIIKEYKYKNDEKAYDWVFATNRKLKSQMWYIRGYKCRWGIETSYRILDEVRIKTTTIDEVKRYFLFVFSCLLYNLWKFANIYLKIKVTFQTFIFVFFNTITEKIKRNKEPPDDIKDLKKAIKIDFL
ncbi:MAG: transposase [Nanoarchaeota archaeon]|nr:transposase [Nanoarchaeota archaeon]MBU1855199.1 transposase [Nanoarchaeota archaeon]